MAPSLLHPSLVRRIALLQALALLVAPLAALAPQPTLAATTLSATNRDQLLVDRDADGEADPGDTLRYTVVVANTGTEDATNLSVGSPLDSNGSLVAGSLRTTPLAFTQVLSTSEDTPLPLTLLGTSASGTTPGFRVTVGPAHGTLGGTAPQLVYTPTLNYSGPDGFSFEICDGETPPRCEIIAISLVVSPVNDAPTASPDSATTSEDTPLGATSVLANDVDSHPGASDEDNLPLTAQVVVSPTHAAGFVLNSDGTFAYTPTLDYNGTDSFSYQAVDSLGGVSAPATVAISVVAVNDDPTARDDSASLTQDAPATAIDVLANDSSAPDSGETLTITSTTTPANGSVQITGGGSGLSYTPDAGFFGSDSFSYTIGDGNGGSATATVSVNVADLNDAPSFAIGPNIVMLEDAGPLNIANWATSISPGPGEAGQALRFNLTGNSNPGLFSPAPSVTPNGTLIFTPTANANGTTVLTFTLSDDGGTANGGQDTSAAQSFTITVTPVNDAPSFVKGADQSVLENAGAQSVGGWATSISPGPGEAGQSVGFNLAGNSNPGLFSVAPAVAPNGTLSYTPAPNAFGSAVITLTLQDDGGTANSGQNTSAAQSFTITVADINNAPSFVKGADQSVLEDAGAQSVSGWATSISPGPGEAGQSVGFNLTGNSNLGLFSVAPAVAPNGTLSYTPAPNAFGSAVITLTLQDDGGTANGGQDTSAAQSFTITVTPVNDAPSFVKGADQSVLEDAGAQSVSGWATSISPGPGEASQSVGFNLTSNSNPGLFSVAPAVAPDGTLSYTPAPNAFGSAVITLTFQDDGGTADSGQNTSAAQSFTITLTPVNDAPSLSGGSDPTVDEDSGATSLSGWATLSAGPSNESGQAISITLENSNPSLFNAAPTLTTTGALSFTPATNAFGSAVITLTLQDNGGTANSGIDTSAPRVFTITVTPVNDPPVVAGESYGTIGNTSLQVAAGSTLTPSVFVAGSLLTNDSDPDGAAVLTASLVSATAGAAVTVNADGSFSYLPPAGRTSGDSFVYQVSDGTDSATATVTISLTQRIWYVKNDAAPGGLGRSSDPFDTLTEAQDSSAAGDIIFVYRGNGSTGGQSAGVVLKNNQLLLGEGVALALPVALNGQPSPTTLVPVGQRPQLSNGGGSGVTLATNNVVRGLNIVNTSGVALNGTNAVTATINTLAITTTGDALSLTNATVTVTLDSVTSNGGSNAVQLSGLTGNVGLGAGALSGSTIGTFLVDGGSAAISYGGSISASSGRAVQISNRNGGDVTLDGAINVSGGTGILISGNSGGTITFAGASKSLSTGANDALTLSGNAGATINITNGGLAITTSSGKGLAATAGGTLNITGANNTIATQTGNALDVRNISIGANDLNFRSVSAGTGASGPANGIVLENTGTAGGLRVSGSGTPGSGGRIQRSSGANGGIPGNGIFLSNTRDISLSWMHLNDHPNHAIRGFDVTNFELLNSVVDGLNGNDNAANEGALSFDGLFGTASISNTTLGGGFEDQLRLLNDDGTLGQLTLQNLTFPVSGVTPGNNAILIEGRGTSSMNVAVRNSTFQGANAQHLSFSTLETASASLQVISNTLTNGYPDSLGGGISLATSGANPTLNYDIDGNSVRGAISNAINAFKGAGAGSMSGFIRNNTIGDPAVAESGSRDASGIQVQLQRSGTHTALISNNRIYRYGVYGIYLVAGSATTASASDRLNATLLGNTVALPGADAADGIHVRAGTSSTAPDSYTLCLRMGGSGPESNQIVDAGNPALGGFDYYLYKRFNTTVQLPGYTGGATDTAAVKSYIEARNVLGATPDGNATASGGGGNYTNTPGGANCPEPSAIALMQAPELEPSDLEQTPDTAGEAGEAGEASEAVLPAEPLGMIQAASFPITIARLPAGETVTITFDVLIDDPLAGGVRQLSSQPTISADGLAPVLTDDPDSAQVGDATLTAIDRDGGSVFVPLLARVGPSPAPDLVVESIGTAGGQLEIVIANVGDAPVTNAFWVDGYINPRSAPTRVNQTWPSVGTRGVVWGILGDALPLEPGERLTLRAGGAYYRADLSAPGTLLATGAALYAQVDSANQSTSYGGVLEGHERDGGPYNNIAAAKASSSVTFEVKPAAGATGAEGLPAR